MTNKNLPDVQKGAPKHLLSIDRVGVSGVDFPLTLRKRDGGEVLVDAKFNMFGSLTKDLKGTNMSRFLRNLMEWVDKPLTGNDFKQLLENMKNELESDDAYLSSSFKYYLSKIAPMSKLKMLMAYECKFVSILHNYGYKFYQEVIVPITSNCPCSKEMSLTDKKNDVGKGAHGQRGLITLQVQSPQNLIWLEDLINICEGSGSCEVYPILKREDEKYVTEKAYANPKFVEDIAREVSKKAMNLNHIGWFRVKVENFESIHNHSATCYMERVKKGKKWVKSYKGLI